MSPHDMILTPTGLRFLGRVWPCSIGRGGLSGTKREGDGATPRGVHHIVGMFYRPDRLPAPAPWAIPIGPRDLWSDDIRDPAYNQLVRAPHGFSHEAMRRADPMYDLVLVTDWNWPEAEPGRGSAIFLHQWRRRCFPTAGCVAFSRADLHAIAPQAVPGTRLVVR